MNDLLDIVRRRTDKQHLEIAELQSQVKDLIARLVKAEEYIALMQSPIRPPELMEVDAPVGRVVRNELPSSYRVAPDSEIFEDEN